MTSDNDTTSSSSLNTAFCRSDDDSSCSVAAADRHSSTTSDVDRQLLYFTSESEDEETEDDDGEDELTSISSLSSTSKLSACSEHSVRIEQYRIQLDAIAEVDVDSEQSSTDSCPSILETRFVPDFGSVVVNRPSSQPCSGHECSYLSDCDLALDDWKSADRLLSTVISCGLWY